jgi:hypothetical protein
MATSSPNKSGLLGVGWPAKAGAHFAILAYNLMRVMQILGTAPLITAMQI